MRSMLLRLVACLGLSGTAALPVPAAVKITQDVLGPDGQIFGGSVSPKGEHMAVLAAKGSHYQVIVDGVAGPRIDSLIVNVSGNAFRPAGYWNTAPIPVIFSKDGAHWAYMAQQGDEFVVIRDGQEFARGPINTRNPAWTLNLTFSANGQHLFWSDDDGHGNYVIVADGKPGPVTHSAPQLVLSADGNHYAYVSYTNQGTGAWAVVDGRQVNYFGDNLQYTARDVLLSTVSQGGTTILVINGKPTLKATGLTPMWVSPDGRQIAVVVTPTPGAETFLTVNGKIVPGTQGLRVENVYFSPDGQHYAALCDTRTNERFMVIDGKKGDSYSSISPQVTNDGATHWQFVTWKVNTATFDGLNPPVPGFTADSSKFVYVANSANRQFLVVNDDESNAFGSLLQPVLSPVGARIAAVGPAPDNVEHVLVDGQDTTQGPAYSTGRVSQFSFSPQGTHYAFLKGNVLYVDNVPQPALLLGNYVFSPDDRHFAYEANVNGQQALIVDGRVVSKQAGMVQHIFFSPDSAHVFWVSTGNLAMQGFPGTRDSHLLYVDGEPAMHYSDNGSQLDLMTDSSDALHPEFSPDDEMTFIARSDNQLRRFHLLPDTTLAAVLAAAPAAGGK